MKLIYFFSFLIFCDLFFSQNLNACELQVIDTVHVKCYQGDNGEVSLLGFNGLEPYSYSIDGLSFQSSNIFDNLTAGDYIFFLKDSNNCIDSLEIKIKEPSVLMLDFVCDSMNNIKSVISGGVEPYSIFWQDSLENVFSTLSQITFSGSHIYYVSVIDSNSCFVEDSIFLQADFELISSIGVAPFEINAINHSIGYTSCLWSTNNQNSSNINFNFEYDIAGDYDLNLIVRNGYGCFDTITKKIIIEGLLYQNEISNVFSPNDDGINDYFNFLENHALVEFYAIIFNRFGKKIFESNDPGMNWDGKNMNGKIVEEGVYFYILTGSGLTGNEYYRKGFINLFR